MSAPEGVVSRRGFMRRSLAAGVGCALAARLAAICWSPRPPSCGRAGKSMILLWMDGGPSQFDTFNPKPGSANQGPAWPSTPSCPACRSPSIGRRRRTVMDKIALIRSMVSSEKEHDRAIALVRTGYPPSPAIRYPTWGSIVAHAARASSTADLPSFVRIGKPRITTRDVDAGVLGVQLQPVQDRRSRAACRRTCARVAPEVVRRRLALAERLDGAVRHDGGAAAVAEKRQVYDRTARLVLSPRVGAFDLSDEPETLRDAYGRTQFWPGLLAGPATGRSRG